MVKRNGVTPFVELAALVLYRRADTLWMIATMWTGNYETDLPVFGFCLRPFNTFAVRPDIALHFRICKLTTRFAKKLNWSCHERIVGNCTFNK